MTSQAEGNRAALTYLTAGLGMSSAQPKLLVASSPESAPRPTQRQEQQPCPCPPTAPVLPQVPLQACTQLCKAEQNPKPALSRSGGKLPKVLLSPTRQPGQGGSLPQLPSVFPEALNLLPPGWQPEPRARRRAGGSGAGWGSPAGEAGWGRGTPSPVTLRAPLLGASWGHRGPEPPPQLQDHTHPLSPPALLTACSSSALGLRPVCHQRGTEHCTGWPAPAASPRQGQPPPPHPPWGQRCQEGCSGYHGGSPPLHPTSCSPSRVTQSHKPHRKAEGRLHLLLTLPHLHGVLGGGLSCWQSDCRGCSEVGQHCPIPRTTPRCPRPLIFASAPWPDALLHRHPSKPHK